MTTEKPTSTFSPLHLEEHKHKQQQMDTYIRY